VLATTWDEFTIFNWRPIFDPKNVHREPEIIRDDLHCNAVRICGCDVGRLAVAAEDALKQGLDVWLSPELWDKSQTKTIDYLTKPQRRRKNCVNNRLINSFSVWVRR
jgi:hypothetical protein